MAEKGSPKKPTLINSNVNNSINNNKNKKKKKKRGGSKRKMSYEETVAYKSVCEWVFLEQSNSSSSSYSGDIAVAEVNDDFGVHWKQPKEKLVFEFHSHSLHSDGFLSPTKLVERAHQNGVSNFCSLIIFLLLRQSVWWIVFSWFWEIGKLICFT